MYLTNINNNLNLLKLLHALNILKPLQNSISNFLMYKMTQILSKFLREGLQPIYDSTISVCFFLFWGLVLVDKDQ